MHVYNNDNTNFEKIHRCQRGQLLVDGDRQVNCSRRWNQLEELQVETKLVHEREGQDATVHGPRRSE